MVELLSQLAHLAENTVGRLRVFDDRPTHVSKVVRVKDNDAVSPCEQVAWGGEVLATPVGDATESHGVDEIKGDMPAGFRG